MAQFTADTLAAHFLAQQGQRIARGEHVEVVAQLTKKQAAWLFDLARRTGYEGPRQHGRRYANGPGWYLEEHLHGSAALTTYASKEVPA